MDPLILAQFIMGGLLLGVIATILLLGRRSEAGTILAAVLTVIIGWAFTASLGIVLPDPGLASKVWDAQALFTLPFELLILYFASTFPVRRAWAPRSRWTTGAFTALCALLLGLFLWDPALYWGPNVGGPGVHLATGSLASVEAVLTSLVILAPLVMLAGYRERPGGVRGSQTLLLAFFLGIVATTHGIGGLPTALFLDVATLRAPLGLAVVGEELVWLWAVELLLLFGVLAFWSFRGSTLEARRGIRRVTAGLGLAVLLWNAVAAWSAVSPTGSQAADLYHAFLDLVLPFLVAYGILRYQLFEIDLKVKRTVRHGSVVAVLALAYVVTNLIARQQLPPETAQTAGVILTGAMLFALVPLQRMGARV
ncbi:MAG: hypothetical protein R3185_02595, partial [Candidatus Thermoplasmatota archaeon]|nr:hypothetical protein [Candidatus Thermoplasmatota archaeon]